MAVGNPVEIRFLQKHEATAAAALCAEAMLDNPIHVLCFGADPVRRRRRLRRFFDGMLAYVLRRGLLLGAFANGRLIGIAGSFPPGRCRPSLADLLRLAPVVLMGNTPPGWWRTLRWLVS